ncbi:leucine zipper putative tumor suppressor 1-like [Heterodontus francisci]|uniref:leucine zipper putative tumor suppressor 1-like n=1 Tax=Heterodontus francisci TaxID=7792 RepID=UPI00355B1DAD
MGVAMAIGEGLHIQFKPDSLENKRQRASLLTFRAAMGSVSSLISGHNLQDKQCKAFEYSTRKASHLNNFIRQQDGLLKSHASHEPTNKGPKTNSKCEKAEDFFYISISQTNGVKNCISELGSQKDGPVMVDLRGPPPALVPFSGQLKEDIETNMVRPTAFKVVVPGNGSTNRNCPLENQTAFQGNVLQPANHSEKKNDEEQKHKTHSGTLSDSGRNSMSSLPTHTTGYSCGMDPIGAPNLLNRFGGSAQYIGLGASSLGDISSNVTSTSTSDSGHCPTSKSMNFSQNLFLPQCASCIRSPPSTDKSVIQGAEEKRSGRGGEMQGLQPALGEKETGALCTAKEKQKRCEQGRDSLTQGCSTKTNRAFQKTQRAQQLRDIQLQQDKTKLEHDLRQLLQERDQLNAKCKSYEREQSEFAPRLEETKWEVCQKSGEISLLKQQLKDSQTELTQKVSEVLTLKNQLRETKGKLSSQDQTVEELQNSLRAKTRELEVCENERQRMKNAAEVLREKAGLLERQIVDLKEGLTSSKELDHAAEIAAASSHADTARPRQQNEQECSALQGDVQRLKAELEQEKRRNQEFFCKFHQERLLWCAEKQKVIQYQKQLQQTYLDVVQQNHSLERAVQQLSMELKARDPVDSQVQRADLHYEEIIATAI